MNFQRFIVFKLAHCYTRSTIRTEVAICLSSLAALRTVDLWVAIDRYVFGRDKYVDGKSKQPEVSDGGFEKVMTLLTNFLQKHDSRDSGKVIS
jgi:hypothetical protein